MQLILLQCPLPFSQLQHAFSICSPLFLSFFLSFCLACLPVVTLTSLHLFLVDPGHAHLYDGNAAACLPALQDASSQGSRRCNIYRLPRTTATAATISTAAPRSGHTPHSSDSIQILLFFCIINILYDFCLSVCLFFWLLSTFIYIFFLVPFNMEIFIIYVTKYFHDYVAGRQENTNKKVGNIT